MGVTHFPELVFPRAPSSRDASDVSQIPGPRCLPDLTEVRNECPSRRRERERDNQLAPDACFELCGTPHHTKMGALRLTAAAKHSHYHHTDNNDATTTPTTTTTTTKTVTPAAAAPHLPPSPVAAGALASPPRPAPGPAGRPGGPVRRGAVRPRPLLLRPLVPGSGRVLGPWCSGGGEDLAWRDKVRRGRGGGGGSVGSVAFACRSRSAGWPIGSSIASLAATAPFPRIRGRRAQKRVPSSWTKPEKNAAFYCCCCCCCCCCWRRCCCRPCPTCDVEDGGAVRFYPGPRARPGVQQLRGLTPQLDLFFIGSLQTTNKTAPGRNRRKRRSERRPAGTPTPQHICCWFVGWSTTHDPTLSPESTRRQLQTKKTRH